MRRPEARFSLALCFLAGASPRTGALVRSLRAQSESPSVSCREQCKDFGRARQEFAPTRNLVST
jgi:hypothetical protein